MLFRSEAIEQEIKLIDEVISCTYNYSSEQQNEIIKSKPSATFFYVVEERNTENEFQRQNKLSVNNKSKESIITDEGMIEYFSSNGYKKEEALRFIDYNNQLHKGKKYNWRKYFEEKAKEWIKQENSNSPQIHYGKNKPQNDNSYQNKNSQTKKIYTDPFHLEDPEVDSESETNYDPDWELRYTSKYRQK